MSPQDSATGTQMIMPGIPDNGPSSDGYGRLAASARCRSGVPRAYRRRPQFRRYRNRKRDTGQACRRRSLWVGYLAHPVLFSVDDSQGRIAKEYHMLNSLRKLFGVEVSDSAGRYGTTDGLDGGITRHLDLASAAAEGDVRVKVVGVGGAGGNAVARMAGAGATGGRVPCREYGRTGFTARQGRAHLCDRSHDDEWNGIGRES